MSVLVTYKHGKCVSTNEQEGRQDCRVASILTPVATVSYTEMDMVYELPRHNVGLDFHCSASRVFPFPPLSVLSVNGEREMKAT